MLKEAPKASPVGSVFGQPGRDTGGVAYLETPMRSDGKVFATLCIQQIDNTVSGRFSVIVLR